MVTLLPLHIEESAISIPATKCRKALAFKALLKKETSERELLPGRNRQANVGTGKAQTQITANESFIRQNPNRIVGTSFYRVKPPVFH
jgi:hypothetical protein